MIIDKVLRIASAIIKQDDKYLLLKRGEGHTFPGHWQLPEGKLEDSETPFQALKRELREEINQDIDNGELVAMTYAPLEAKGIKYLATRVVFVVKVKTTDIKTSDEHADFGWFTKEDIGDLPLLLGTKETVEEYLKTL